MNPLEVVLTALAVGGATVAMLQKRQATLARTREGKAQEKFELQVAELDHLRTEVRSLREKQTEQARTLSTATKLSMVADMTSDGACLCNPGGTIEWVNKAWEQTTGYTLGEVQGKKPGHVLQGADTDQNTVARIREALQTKKPLTVELVNYAKSGARLWVRMTIRPIKDAKGAHLGFLGTQTDLTLKQLTQKRLERLHERAELALTAGNFGIWEWWPQPNRCEWDERCGKLYGGVNPASTYEEWMQNIHKQDLPGVEAHLRAVLLGKEQLKISFRLAQTPERHLEIRGQVQRDEHGTPNRMTGLVRDISDELALREELHLAGERLRLSLQGSNNGVWEWNILENRIEADEKWALLTGHRSDSRVMSRQSFEKSIHPEDLALVRTILDAHLSGRTPHFETECRISRSHGDWIWVHWKGTIVAKEADGKPRMMCGTYSDVSGKHHTEEALRRSALLLRQMCQEMGVAAWQIEAENFTLHWTEELDLLHVAPPDFEPSLEHLLALYPGDSRTELSRSLELSLEKGMSFDVEVRWRAPGSDKNRWFRWTGTPVIAEGHIQAVCGLIHDVTSVRETIAQRRELDAKLAELQQYEAMSAITDDLAFDLNSMLSSLIGFQELATEELPDGHAAKQFVNEATAKTGRIHEIIRQVLLLNRVKPAARIGVRPAMLVEELFERMGSSLPSHITLTKNIDKRCPAITGDAAQLQQAFLHIAHHAAAVLLTHPGRMEINLQAEEVSMDKASSLGMSISGQCACVEIRVAREKLSDAEWGQLFDNPAQDPGLNLTAARKILGEHQGVLSVEYHPVHGGICRAWIPLAQTVEAVPPSSDPTPRGKGELIWLVDEERFVAKLAKLTLERNGYLVEIFRSVQDCEGAMAKRADRCALLILGHTVKLAAAKGLAEQTRKTTAELPILIMSNEPIDASWQNVDRLPDPFTATDLGKAIHSMLRPQPSIASLVRVN